MDNISLSVILIVIGIKRVKLFEFGQYFNVSDSAKRVKLLEFEWIVLKELS